MKRLFLVFIILFVFTTQTSQAQVAKDTLLAFQYFKKADSLINHEKYNSSINLYEKALVIYKDNQTWEKVASCYNKLSNTYRRKIKYEQSYSNAQKALKISNAYLPENNKEKATAYYNLGKYYAFSETDYKTTLEYYQKSLNVLEKTEKKYYSDIINMHNAMALTFIRIGKSKVAIDHLEKALKIGLDKTGEQNSYVIQTYGYLAIAQKKIGNYQTAIKFYKKTIGLAKEVHGKNHSIIAKNYSNMAMVYKRINQYDIAMNFCKKSLAIRKKLGQENHPDIAGTYSTLGSLSRKNGDFEKAIKYYKKALRILNNELKSAYLYINISNVYIETEEYDKALLYNEKALAINIKKYGKNHIWIASSYLNIAHIYKEKREYDIAFDYCKKSLDILTTLFDDNHPKIASAYDYIGNIYFDKKEYTKAIENYTKSYNIRKSKSKINNSNVSESLYYIANAYLEMKDFENAMINYDKAEITNLRPEGKSKSKNSFYSNKYFNLNNHLLILEGKGKNYTGFFKQRNTISDLNNALNIYQKLDTIINQIRQNHTDYNDKITFAKKAKEIYQKAISSQLLLYTLQKEQKSLEKAFYYLEKSKSNTLKELLADLQSKNYNNLPDDLLRLEKELKINHSIYLSKILKEKAKKQIDTSKITELEGELFNINRQQDSINTILKKDHFKYYEIKYKNDIAGLQKVQQQLNEETTILEFFSSDSITYAFTVTKNDIAVQELATPQLTERVEVFQKSILTRDLDAFKQKGHHLYNQLIKPIADKLVGDQLKIIPDESLWHLNFELLLTKEESSNNPKNLSYFLKDYAISYANSTNLLFTSFNDNSTSKTQQECLAFSFSDSTQTSENRAISLAALRDSKQDLPGTREEIRAISNIIDGQYFYGSQAIEANFKKNASRYNILHLALHGDVDHEQPENSKLYFTKSKDTLEDNLLYGHELFALDIPAELTVLSACNTGSGKIAKGEGIMSLGTAFQYAGTKSLLLTGWEVSDTTTPELMKYFYTNLSEGMNKAKALQQAKLKYLANTNINRLDPFYWGAFYLVGDVAPMHFSNSSRLYWILGISVLVILLLLIFWYRRKKI